MTTTTITTVRYFLKRCPVCGAVLHVRRLELSLPLHPVRDYDVVICFGSYWDGEPLEQDALPERAPAPR